MSKTLENNNLASRPAARALAAISLSLTLAAFGCTTDRNLGNGDPVTTPGLRTSPAGGTSSGSESTPTIPPSMTSSSSYVGAQAIPSGTQRMRKLSAAEAAAVIADQAPRVRYLGTTYGKGGRYASDSVVTGQFQNPALRTNPQMTINSSISSQPTSAIASGSGESVGGSVDAAALLGGDDISGVTIGSGITAAATNTALGTGTGLGMGGNTGGAVFSPLAVSTAPFGTTATTLTPTISPTAFTSITPAAATSGLGTLTAPSTLTQATTANTTNATTTNAPTMVTGSTTADATVSTSDTATSTTVSTTNATRNVRVASPVQITRDANGRVVVTNTNTTTTRRNR